MTSLTHDLRFNGGILQRGFWLYVWEITPPEREPLYYVGRTGDSSSPYAQSPFNRMGQHLGFTQNSNMLRRHLEKAGVTPEQCEFRLVAHGPIDTESTAEDRADHNRRRDRVAAMEKALADTMRVANYTVINEVQSRKPLDEERFAKVRAAFAVSFPKLTA